MLLRYFRGLPHYAVHRLLCALAQLVFTSDQLLLLLRGLLRWRLGVYLRLLRGRTVVLAGLLRGIRWLFFARRVDFELGGDTAQGLN